MQTINNTRTYPEVLKTLTNVIDGTPRVQTFETVISTFHNVLSSAKTSYVQATRCSGQYS